MTEGVANPQTSLCVLCVAYAGKTCSDRNADGTAKVPVSCGDDFTHKDGDTACSACEDDAIECCTGACHSTSPVARLPGRV